MGRRSDKGLDDGGWVAGGEEAGEESCLTEGIRSWPSPSPAGGSRSTSPARLCLHSSRSGICVELSSSPT